MGVVSQKRQDRQDMTCFCSIRPSYNKYIRRSSLIRGPFQHLRSMGRPRTTNLRVSLIESSAKSDTHFLRSKHILTLPNPTVK